MWKTLNPPLPLPVDGPAAGAAFRARAAQRPAATPVVGGCGREIEIGSRMMRSIKACTDTMMTSITSSFKSSPAFALCVCVCVRLDGYRCDKERREPKRFMSMYMWVWVQLIMLPKGFVTCPGYVRPVQPFISVTACLGMESRVDLRRTFHVFLLWLGAQRLVSLRNACDVEYRAPSF